MTLVKIESVGISLGKSGSRETNQPSGDLPSFLLYQPLIIIISAVNHHHISRFLSSYQPLIIIMIVRAKVTLGQVNMVLYHLMLLHLVWHHLEG